MITAKNSKHIQTKGYLTMSRNLSLLRDKLRADKRCQRLHTLFNELPIYQIGIEGLTKEIEQIHKTRNIRFLSQNTPRFIEAIVDASILDQANRSRMVEISMGCYRAETTLLEALDPLRSYLLLHYAEDFVGIRTKDERLQILNMALSPFLKFVARTTQVRTLANMVIDDVDKGAWSLKLLVSAYQLKIGRGEQTI